jgi:riboflavin biosynthesis pyrimidine reductase
MDAILCGPRTFQLDNPTLTARPGGIDAEFQPLRVFITGSQPLSAELNALSSPSECLWVCADEKGDDPVLAKRLEAGDRQLLLPMGESGRVDLAALCSSLYADFGVRRLLVEGGAQIQGAMVDLGLLDAVVRYEGPILFGGGHGASLGSGVISPDEAIRLGEEERADLGDDLRRAFLVID